jgi:hypothetical protein
MREIRLLTETSTQIRVSVRPKAPLPPIREGSRRSLQEVGILASVFITLRWLRPKTLEVSTVPISLLAEPITPLPRYDNCDLWRPADCGSLLWERSCGM